MSAVVVAAVLAFAFTPLFALLAKLLGLFDLPDKRKDHGAPVPFLGGVAVWVAFAACAAFTEPGDPDPERAKREALLLGSACALAAGIWDDLRRGSLSPLRKFAVQGLAAAAAIRLGLRLRLLEAPLSDALLTAFWLLLATNAVNWLDNMNGLAAGLVAIAGGTLLALDPMGAGAGALLGACLGFLPWNFPRARVFLGDAGSHGLGFAAAVLAARACAERAGSPAQQALPLFALAVPVLDLLRVVWVRLWLGRHPWVADHLHVSHRLAERLGRVGAVLALWALAAAVGGGALLAAR